MKSRALLVWQLMRILPLFLVFSWYSCFGGQFVLPSVLVDKPLDWSAWEVPLSKDVRAQLIHQVLSSDYVKFIDPGEKANDAFPSFHIVDFNADGLNDIIFFGYDGSEVKRVVFFENKGSSFSGIIGLFGELVALRREIPLVPLSFTVIEYPCCAGYTLHVEQYVPVRKDGALAYALSSKNAYTVTTHFPEKFTMQKACETTSDSAALRSSPEVSLVLDARYRGAITNEGNLLAQYPAGSHGVVLAQAENTAGESWSFVLMFLNKNTKRDIFHTGKNNTESYNKFGWIRSSELRVK